MLTGKDQETDVSLEGTDEYLIEALTDQIRHLGEQGRIVSKRRRELRQWRRSLLAQRQATDSRGSAGGSRGDENQAPQQTPPGFVESP